MLARTLILPLAALALVAAAPAAADEAIAELGRDAPVAGYGGWIAWSRYDETTGRYALTLRDPGGAVKAAPLPTSKRPWDVSLGPDAQGNVVAIYQRCAAKGCDLRLLDVASGREQALPSVSSPFYDEATPAIWRSTVVFTRRVRGCDVPYVKNLARRAPSRRLRNGKCLQTPAGNASIRGTRIVISSVDTSRADANGAGPKTSELRRYSSRAAGSRVILAQRFGEESNLFGQVAQDDRFAYTVRYGVHPMNTFVRLAWTGGRPQEVRAFRTITGAFAKPTANSSLYVEEQGDTPCDGFTDVPCRIVRSPSVPFSGVQRTLTPQLTVAYQGPARSGQPLTFSGQLTQQVVTRDNVVSTNPVPGVTVELYHRFDSDPERFEATGQRAVTGADGSYGIVLPALPGNPWYTAVAATPDTPTWAGRGTIGSAAP